VIAAQPIPIVASVASRQIRMLRSAMGAAIAAALEGSGALLVQRPMNPE